MSNNKHIEGLPIATQKGMLAGNPRDSAMLSMNNNSQLQAQANNSLSGGRLRKRKSYRGGEAIAVQQYQMLYEPQGGPGTNPNNIIAKSAQTSTQGAANAALDKGATITGGSKHSGHKHSGHKRSGSKRRRSRKGGNPDWLWGCMSGGKKRSRKNTKRRKSRKYRKH
jgi:hypothetical protein